MDVTRQSFQRCLVGWVCGVRDKKGKEQIILVIALIGAPCENDGQTLFLDKEILKNEQIWDNNYQWSPMELQFETDSKKTTSR